MVAPAQDTASRDPNGKQKVFSPRPCAPCCRRDKRMQQNTTAGTSDGPKPRPFGERAWIHFPDSQTISAQSATREGVCAPQAGPRGKAPELQPVEFSRCWSWGCFAEQPAPPCRVESPGRNPQS